MDPCIPKLTLEIWKLLIEFPEFRGPIIEKLLSSPFFAISTSQLWSIYPQEITSISRQNLISFDDSYFSKQLEKSLTAPNGPDFLSHADVFYFLLFNFYQLSSLNADHLPFMHHAGFPARVFLHILEEFLYRPRIALGYLVLSTPTMFYAKPSSETPPLQLMLDCIKKLFDEKYIKMRLTISLNDLVPLFFDIPDEDLSFSDLLHATKRYPSLVASLIPRVREVFQSSSYQSAILFAKEMSKEIDDTICLLAVTKQLYDFLNDLIRMTSKTKNMEHFEPLADLLFNILICYWRNASQNDRNMLLTIGDPSSGFEPQIQYFIHQFLKCQLISDTEEKPTFPFSERWNKRETPLIQLAYIYAIISQPNGTSIIRDMALQMPLSKPGFLWLPIICWSIRHNCPDLMDLIQSHLYQSDLFSGAFYIYMLRIRKTEIPWRTIQYVPDFDLKLYFSPPSLTDVITIIQDQVVQILSIKQLSREIGRNMTCSWRAFSHAFGFPKFAKSLFNFLGNYSAELDHHHGAKRAYSAVGMLLIPITSEYDFASTMIDYIEKETFSNEHATNLAKLSYFTLMGSEEHKFEELKTLILWATCDLQKAEHLGNPRTIFAIEFLSRIIEDQKNISLIPREVANDFLRLHLWDIAISFYKLLRE